jgi:hypothetical protein
MEWVVELRRAEVACPVEHEGAYRRAMVRIAELMEAAYVVRDRVDCVVDGGAVLAGAVPDICESGQDERRDESL